MGKSRSATVPQAVNFSSPVNFVQGSARLEMPYLSGGSHQASSYNSAQPLSFGDTAGHPAYASGATGAAYASGASAHYLPAYHASGASTHASAGSAYGSGVASAQYPGSSAHDSGILGKAGKTYASGFGIKMLEKMGWTTGRGLGKDEQGILTPILVDVRPRNLGMGYGSKVELTPSEKAELVMDMRRMVNSEAASQGIPEFRNKLKMLVDTVHVDWGSRRLRVMHTFISHLHGVNSSLAAWAFAELRNDFPEEYKQYNLSSLAFLHAVPNMVDRYQDWEPLQDPFRGINMLMCWSKVLSEEQEETSPYMHLLMEVVIPHIRRAVEGWEVRDPEPLKEFISMWEKFLPSSVLRYILEDMVLSKLETVANTWDPVEDKGLHLCIQPWMPHVDTKKIVEVVEKRLENVLRSWKANDGSAVLIVYPWRKVINPVSWERIMLRNVVPKLKTALDTHLVITDDQQPVESFYWLMWWAGILPVPFMVKLLESCFFPKWLDCLYAWLQKNPDFATVALWYEGWKSFLTPELLKNESVCRKMNMALDMMDRALKGLQVEKRF